MNRTVVIDTCAIIHLMYIDSFRLLESLKYYAVTTVFVRLEFEGGHEDSRKYFSSLVADDKIYQIALD